MWRSLREKFTPASVADTDKFEEYLTTAVFAVAMKAEAGSTRMLKQEWYEKLRRRVFSSVVLVNQNKY